MDETTVWLTSEQEDAWRSLMAGLMLLPGALDAQLQRDAALTHAGYTVLSSLSEAPERAIRMSRLAAMANMSMSRLSHLVDRLEGQGWVERQPVPGDGRSTMAVLTETGWEKVVATAPGHVDNVRTLIFDELSAAQVKQLKKIFDTVNARLDPENRLRGCGGAVRP
ncbi:MarR family winged helix-turn-helix transcriptional regulator [Georgenia subflava]|uniref:MarR family transcriptional regulator n=1 Tax=Georgenia subflava TaxID=1622177 RepID=A0A6N7ELQ6_9MICO|nr:MarR family transcriptional regulator [Georgenia subflava]MPV36184.1 MarR family transcriptional regulator [Georgenia subflava]